MEINLLFFGQVAEITGVAHLTIPDIKDTAELRNWLIKKWPTLQFINYAIAINKGIIQGNVELKQDDTVALLPPFSGG